MIRTLPIPYLFTKLLNNSKCEVGINKTTYRYRICYALDQSSGSEPFCSNTNPILLLQVTESKYKLNICIGTGIPPPHNCHLIYQNIFYIQKVFFHAVSAI